MAKPVVPYGWDGSAWRKLPLLWGYSDRWAEVQTGAASGAGNASCNTAAVPAGYVYVAQLVVAYHDAAAAKQISIWANAPSLYAELIHELSATALLRYRWSGALTLKTGDTVNARADAPGDGKSIFLRVWGYKMKVAE